MFLFMAQITQILLFLGMWFCLERRSQFENATFPEKKLSMEVFRYVSTLRKKVFLGPSVKFVFLYGSNKTDFVVFGNAALGEIEDHRYRTTPFQKTLI